MAGDVVLLLLHAQALEARLGSPDDWMDASASRDIARLERAIRRAERELTPGRWTAHEDYDGVRVRSWPKPSTTTAAWVDDLGWEARAPDFALIARGPETGAEGRRLADRALSRWLRRQGVEWAGDNKRRGR